MIVLLFRKAPEKGTEEKDECLKQGRKTKRDEDIEVSYFIITTSLYHFIPRPIIKSVLTDLVPWSEQPSYYLLLLVSKPSYVR